jgi:diguanylate cyclase (GGDEF)-like protein
MKYKRQLWILSAVLITLVGGAGSILGAHDIARSDGADSHELFNTTASSIVSTLNLGIQHEQDLVDTMGSYFATFPNANQRNLMEYTATLKTLKRYPELTGIAEIVLVRRAQLANFETSALANPIGGSMAPHTLQVTPVGDRPYYCFAKDQITRSGLAGAPAGLDYCNTPLGPSFMRARATGQWAYFPFSLSGSQDVVVGTPIYKAGAAITTAAQRDASFVGWTGISLVPHVLLAAALRTHANTLVKFQFSSGGITGIFRAGAAPAGAHVRNVDLHNGWKVAIYGALDNGGIFSNVNALALLLVGLALSLLLGAMIWVLGTGRSRALTLVRERTSDLEYIATHDALTGLPNRALILERISQMSNRSRRDRTKSAVLFLDLDNFKDVNDTLGHNVGDQLLIAVGSRLAKAMRGGDTVGRLGGDEFVILAEGDSLDPDSDELARRILDCLSEPFVVSGSSNPLPVSASIGIAQGGLEYSEDMLRDADIAMYRAKSLGKRCAVDFLPSMQEDIVVQRTLVTDLQKALDNNEFFLLYQPVVDLKSGAMIGVEALLRWSHPQRGVIQPDLFIPTLESSGLIVPVGLWVLREACRQGAVWAASGMGLHMSVNISAKQIEHDRIVTDVQNALSESGFSPYALTLELTETTLMANVEASIERLHRLKVLGINLAIDDFGTGYSSIAYLRQFPVDAIKIDRSFISNIVDSAEAAVLVRTLVQLGKDLGLLIVAEGVETDSQRAKLVAENTDYAQGFLFARPLAADGVAELSLLPVVPVGADVTQSSPWDNVHIVRAH